jgi:hypothetical protein
MKLRTTVQLTSAIGSTVAAQAQKKREQSLKREDSFIARFSTRQVAEQVPYRTYKIFSILTTHFLILLLNIIRIQYMYNVRRVVDIDPHRATISHPPPFFPLTKKKRERRRRLIPYHFMNN